ncbi:MAG: hypothetical protein U0414_33365 [Polyangiaceae bacterium]
MNCRWLGWVVLGSLVACEEPPAPPSATGSVAKSTAPAKASQSSAGSAASASSAPAASASAAASVVPSAAPTVVASAPPAAVSAGWPKEDAPPPAKEAWASAEEINTADPKIRAKGCKLVRLGEWFKATCASRSMVMPEGSNGKSGTDFFAKSALEGEVIVRSKPGAVMGFSFSGGADTKAHLRLAWPTTAAWPTVAMLDVAQTTTLEIAQAKEVGDIPDLPPDTGEPVPPPADWIDGVAVNTAPKANRVQPCSLRVVRRWLRRDCGGMVVSPSIDGGGASGKDYIDKPDVYRSLLFLRLHEGMKVYSAFSVSTPTQGDKNGELKVEWPSGSPKPTVIEARATE